MFMGMIHYLFSVVTAFLDPSVEMVEIRYCLVRFISFPCSVNHTVTSL